MGSSQQFELHVIIMCLPSVPRILELDRAVKMVAFSFSSIYIVGRISKGWAVLGLVSIHMIGTLIALGRKPTTLGTHCDTLLLRFAACLFLQLFLFRAICCI